MKVAVVDDHPLVREGIRSVLEMEDDFELVGSAGSGRDAQQLIPPLHPDVVMVDLRLPGEYGVEIIKNLRPHLPGCRFIVLTTYSGAEDISQALEAGVDGYILKEALPEEMLLALRLVGRGRPYFDPAVMQSVVRQPRGDNAQLSELTGRELDVLRALARGLSNKEIAALLYITEHTVKKHISGILGKLQLKDRVQAALYAAAHGIANNDAHGSGVPD